VYTDGACSGNPGPGGWAWAVVDGAHGYGSENPSTNQRMEVYAVFDALSTLLARTFDEIVVVSDSTYVVKCFNDKWWEGWERRGWKNSQKQPVANQDLWKPLVSLVRSHIDRVAFRWVKGHSGNVMNDRVDVLAVAACANRASRTVVGFDEFSTPVAVSSSVSLGQELSSSPVAMSLFD
jgi:ribonuclease HI